MGDEVYLNLKQLFDEIGVEIDTEDLSTVDLSRLSGENLESIEISSAIKRRILTGESISGDEIQESFSELVSVSKEIRRSERYFFSGPSAAELIHEAFNSPAAEAALRRLRDRYENEEVTQDHILSAWDLLEDELAMRAEAGELMDLRAGARTRIHHYLMHENIGHISLVADQSMFYLTQHGATMPLAASDGTVVDPGSDVGWMITLFDMFLEVLGGALLLLNVVLPRIKWNKLLDALDNRKHPGFFNHLNALLAELAKAIAEGEGNEVILNIALKLLKWAFGTDAVWELVESALDLGWFDWVKMVGHFIALWAAEAASGGIATAGKLVVIGSTLYDVVGKAEKLGSTDVELPGVD